MTDESSDLADDIVPELPKHSSFDRKFAPWHKVRKEYVRKEQWNKHIIRYVDRHLRRVLQTAGGGEWDSNEEIPESIRKECPLNCLVIPGDDLLDVRSLHRDTESIQCYIRYLGFNSGKGSEKKGTRLHIAHNDVTSLDRIANNSIVLHDPFQVVAKRSSQAYRYVNDLGPFHIINLDLCDSLFPNKDGDLKSYYEALHSISAFQMKELSIPWIMFITTEVAPGEVDSAQLDLLCAPTKTNVNSHSEFANEFSSLMPTDLLTAGANGEVDCSQLNDQQLVDLFGVAIGKALLSFCSTADPKWKLRMLGSHIYGINPEKNVSMLSLAFQFTPVSIAPEDKTGLSTLKFEPQKPFDEAELATKIVKSVKNISDIDLILESDPTMHAELLSSSADLLAAADYDRDAYVQWVADGEQTSYD